MMLHSPEIGGLSRGCPMPEKKAIPTRGAKRALATGKRKKRENSAPERPPESAENFEHTLRRLMIERDERSKRR